LGTQYIRFLTDTIEAFVDKPSDNPDRGINRLGGSSMGLVSYFSGLIYPRFSLEVDGVLPFSLGNSKN